MPICTTCAHPTQYLYTVYNSADNLRLEQCVNPYVEHDTLTLWIDLILLKRDVYRHLLFNRGLGARNLSEKTSDPKASEPHDSVQQTSSSRSSCRSREMARWLHILKLGAALIAVDAFIRWTHLTFDIGIHTTYMDILQWNPDAVGGYFRILVGCLIETLGFHAGILFSSFAILHALDWARSTILRRPPPRSGTQLEFRYSNIPLAIFYSSLNKLFLLFLLTIWRPAPASPGTSQRPLPPQFNASNMFTNPVVVGALEMLDDDKLDREWIVRNVLGGMAAGFGLRVVLDCHPLFTTMVILTGWGFKTVVANLVSAWVGAGLVGNERVGEEMWLSYSIP